MWNVVEKEKPKETVAHVWTVDQELESPILLLSVSIDAAIGHLFDVFR
jgi:hypothetical protein